MCNGVREETGESGEKQDVKRVVGASLSWPGRPSEQAT